MTKRFVLWFCFCLILLGQALAASDYAAWLARVEGVFAGEHNKTPFGEIPFAIEMVKEADGSVRGRAHADSETYLDFKFYLNEQGEILFSEGGGLPGPLVQSNVLELVSAEGDTLTFETKKRPGYLIAKVTADGDRLRIQAILRGKPHANLDLVRVRDEKQIADIRAWREQAKKAAAGSYLERLPRYAEAKVDPGLSKAERARQYLAEAERFAAQLESGSRADVPTIAMKMKVNLEKALELDPSLDKAHFMLAVWYLRAPEFAGGSAAKAREILQLLEERNSPLADALRKEISW